jgi:SagB-type dehydrogenase family enzyme
MEPYVLAFRRGFSLIEQEDGGAALSAPWGPTGLGRLSAGLRDALNVMTNGGATGEELARRVEAGDGPGAVPVWFYCLEQWDRMALVTRSVSGPEGPLATLVPTSFFLRFTPGRIEDERSYVLSRFASVRRAEDHLIVESALAPGRLEIRSPQGAALLARLAAPVPGGDLAGGTGRCAEAARHLLEMLAGTGMICRLGDSGTPEEDEDPVLAQWEFHDLLFHFRSRMGRHDYPSGATYPFLGRIEPLPAVRPEFSGRAVPLPRPDLETLMKTDPPFARVQEERRSIREQGEQPITLGQLGELLYRTARLRRVLPPDERNGLLYEASDRPYPNGGASYELELYITVRECDGLAPGLYHYSAAAHQLHEIPGAEPYLPLLLRDAYESSARQCMPQVLLTLTARFQRLGWKYRSMAYATILKNTGVLYQTLYLAATAMGLAVCGLGNGNAELMARAIGTSYFEESSVGELMLGSRREP